MSQTSPALPEGPKKKRTGLIIGIVAAAVVVIAALAIIIPQVTSSGDDRGTSAENPIKIGVVGSSDEFWGLYQAAAEQEGIFIDLVDFAEYAQVNPSTSEGATDVNQFQHIPYLAEYNSSVAEDQQLVPIGSTAIYPLGLYSTKYDSVEDIPEGSTIVVSNSPSNQARALLILQAQGLLELADGGSPFSRIADIESSTVEVVEANPELTPNSLPDVAAAFINNDFVEDAGLTFADAIAKDDPTTVEAEPYVNIFAARQDDADNETFLKLVEIFQTDQATLDSHQENSGGTAIFVQWDAAKLNAILADVTEAYQASK